MFFLFFYIIRLYFLIPAVTAQIFNPTAELAVPTGTPTNEPNAEIKTQPLTEEAKTRKCSKKFKALNFFLCFSLIKSLCFISLKG